RRETHRCSTWNGAPIPDGPASRRLGAGGRPRRAGEGAAADRVPGALRPALTSRHPPRRAYGDVTIVAWRPGRPPPRVAVGENSGPLSGRSPPWSPIAP